MKTILHSLLFSVLFLSSNALALGKSGTGFAVSSNLVLTAYHVVENGESISVSFGETSFSARVSSFNKDLDWALLKISGAAPATIQIGDSDSVKLGDEVYTLGFPATDLLGNEIKFSKGEIGSLTGLGGNKSHFQISVPIQPGNSGGPLFSKSGKAVGIIVSTIDPGVFFSVTEGALPQGINFALKINEIRELKPALRTSGITAVETNQRAIGFISVQVRRTSIVPPKRPSPPVLPPPETVETNEYEQKLKEIEERLKAINSQLTGFSPDTFCQTNGVSCPILTEDEADAAEDFLNRTKKEFFYAIESAKTEILNFPARKKFVTATTSGLTRKEKDIFDSFSPSAEWLSARNRLAEHYNALMVEKGVPAPTSFWGLSIDKESFKRFSHWEDMPTVPNASIGAFILEKPFLGSLVVRGIRSKTRQTPVALWCRIPTDMKSFTSNRDLFTLPEPLYDVSDYSNRKDLSGRNLSAEEFCENRANLINMATRIFERKYRFRFTLSEESNERERLGQVIPILGMLEGAVRPKPNSVLYRHRFHALDIEIRRFGGSLWHPIVGTIVFISIPNWRTILEEEQQATKMSETIKIDDSMLDSL